MNPVGHESTRLTDESADSALCEIDALLEGLAELSKSSVDRKAFYQGFLDRVVRCVISDGGAVWCPPNNQSGLTVAAAVGWCGNEAGTAPAVAAWRKDAATWIVGAKFAKAVGPRFSVDADLPVPNPTERLFLFVPWTADDSATGVVEIVTNPGASPALQEGYLRFVEAACEILAEFERRALLAEMRDEQRFWAQLDEFARRVHASLDTKPVAYVIANEALRFLACDRVSVLVRRGRAYEVVAVSGAESFSRRANTVRLLERLVAAALATGEALWHPVEKELAPQIEEPLDSFLDESHARGLGIVPLWSASSDDESLPRKIVGALAIEQFYGPATERLRVAATAVASHGALAIQNALTLERLPLARFQRKLGFLGSGLRGRRLAGWAGALVAVMAVIAALVLVPADFGVEAKGELQPVILRDIFAPDDAVAVELRAQTGSRVAVDQVVLVLRKPSLELEIKRVWGELQTARKRLAAVESEQLLNRRADDSQRQRQTELTAQQEELRSLVAALQSQYDILRRQESDLEVRSPISGELLTWDAEPLLATRPVVRGQVLLTVADLSGPWRLELRIPERRISHLAAAMTGRDEPLEISFALATNPGRVLRARLERLGGRAEFSEADGPVILASAAIDAEEIPERVPGATVVARVHCGRRSVGYVWFHDLIDAVRTWVLF